MLGPRRTKPYGDRTLPRQGGGRDSWRIPSRREEQSWTGTWLLQSLSWCLASLAGGDNVDATTVSYFLSVALAKKKDEEEKEMEVEREGGGGGEGEGGAEGGSSRTTPAQEAAWRRWMGIAPGSSSSSSVCS